MLYSVVVIDTECIGSCKAKYHEIYHDHDGPYDSLNRYHLSNPPERVQLVSITTTEYNIMW
jgi:hypothetical protein